MLKKLGPPRRPSRLRYIWIKHFLIDIVEMQAEYEYTMNEDEFENYELICIRDSSKNILTDVPQWFYDILDFSFDIEEMIENGVLEE